MVLMTEDELKGYLDGCIRHWRGVRDNRDTDLVDNGAPGMAECYVDAFQSVRMSYFGELLPVVTDTDGN